MSAARNLPRVAIVGAGFGGLWAARGLARAPVEVMLIDRNNYHTFVPFLYQAAAALLGADALVYPVRSLLRRLPNVRFTLAEVRKVDPARRVLECDGREIGYDYLVLAPGSTPHYFGIPGTERHAFPLRTLDDAITLRNHVLTCLERASGEANETRRRQVLTVAVVGGGATGVEFAGSVAELIQGPVRKDFPELPLGEVRIVLVEAADRLLPGYPERLSRYAWRRLQDLGVEVRVETAVTEIAPGRLSLRDAEPILTDTVVWTAGHRGHPLGEASGMPVNRKGQITVRPTLQVPNHPTIYVVGDLAGLEEEPGPLPMVAPVAMQEGETAARNILRQLADLPPEPFRYHDKGMLAVVGRNAAVARFGNRAFTGFPAWVLWGLVHIAQLIGFRNRLVVLLNWLWDYLLYERVVRLILPRPRAPR